MESTKRLWGVLDYGLTGLSQEESENANKDIVQAIGDINTLKAKADLLDDIASSLKRHWEHCQLDTESGCRVCEMHQKAKELQCTNPKK